MRIFIACPAHVATGGTELLHQYSKSLTDAGIENYMLYYDHVRPDVCPTPPTFEKYGVHFVFQFEDAPDSILVVPETRIEETENVNQGISMVWWLSVDNYLSYYSKFITEENIDLFQLKKKENVVHFVQSHYAKDFLLNRMHITESVYFLKDYINDAIMENAFIENEVTSRENICLYNPKKGFEVLEPIIQMSDERVNWVPIQGLTPEKVSELMHKAKLYVDFGNHPGKDRIPREAAISGCCVITNCKGAAAYNGDVPIEEQYKIKDTTNAESVLNIIYDVLEHYDEHIQNFAGYRLSILGEKEEFYSQVQKSIGVLKEEVKVNRNRFIKQLEYEQDTKNLDEIIVKLEKTRMDWVSKVFDLLMKKHYTEAESEFYGILLDQSGNVQEKWLNTEASVLTIFFNIHRSELENGEESIFSLIHSVDEMVDVYSELKFLLRRFENKLPDDMKKELVYFLRKYPVSGYALVEMIRFYIVKKEYVFNSVAVFLFQNEFYDMVLPLLMSAYKENACNKMTLFHLAYILNIFGETALARQFAEQISDKSEEVVLLEHAINDNGQLPDITVMLETKDEPNKILPTVSCSEKEETVSFIICVNNDRYYKECCAYIKQLLVPEGYQIELHPVYNADSMTSAYQTAMEQVDAKYKIYMHQDAMCLNPYLLYEAIHVFEKNPEIGMIGPVGCVKMPSTGMWWDARKGTYYNLYEDCVSAFNFDQSVLDVGAYEQKEYQEVQVLDGVFLMTSKDVDWRKDLFDGWHFYDMSQSMEFGRAGYKLAVPYTEQLWVLHYEKTTGELGNDYREYRIRFLKEYEGNC